MTDYSTLSDSELCERISCIKEPDPIVAHFKNPKVDSRAWTFKLACDNKINFPYTHAYPFNWLSWEYLGRLFEELPAAIRMQVSAVSTEKLRRAICEAWLEENEK